MDLMTLLIVFIAVTAVAVVLQTLILAGVGITVFKIGKRMQSMQEKVNEQVLPMMEKTRTLVDQSIPKLEKVVDNITESSVVVRSQAEKIDGAVTQIVESVRKQAERIDVMTTRTLERVDSTAATVQSTVTAPIRRIGGVLEGVIAGVGNLAGRRRKEARTAKAGVPTEDRAVPSQEMFI